MSGELVAALQESQGALSDKQALWLAWATSRLSSGWVPSLLLVAAFESFLESPSDKAMIGRLEPSSDKKTLGLAEATFRCSSDER
jgi:hypothetical protein